MKKKTILLSLVLIFIFFCMSVYAKDITIEADGKTVKCDVAPFIENNRTLIPLRGVFETIGADVKWNQDQRKAEVSYGSQNVVLYIGNETAYVNGVPKKLDTVPVIKNSRTFIPVRFVSEGLGFSVKWDSDNYKVLISTTPDSVEATQIRSVSVTETSEEFKITVSGAGGIVPEKMTLTSPVRYVFDFNNAVFEGKSYEKQFGYGGLNAVRSAQFNDKTVRVVADVKSMLSYSESTSGGDYIITVKKAKDDVPGNSEENNPDISGYILPAANEKAKSRLVILDAGHGGSDVGTIGKKDGKEYYEKDINIDITNNVNAMLKSAGMKTYMIRENDDTVDILKRPVIGNEQKGDIFVCIHNNAAQNTGTRGTQIYYSDSEASFSNMTNKEVGKVFYDNITSLGLRKAGMVDNPRYIVIYRSDMPSFIIENLFLSNQEDLNLALDPSFRKKLAYEIAKSVIEILNKAEK